MIIVMIPLMIAAGIFTHITARHSVARQTSVQADNPQTAIMNKLMLYLFPIGVRGRGAFLPLAVLLYWVANNAWTLGQQYVVYRKIDSEESAKKDAAVAIQQARAPRPGQKPVRPETVEPVADAERHARARPRTPGAKPVARKPRPAGGGARRSSRVDQGHGERDRSWNGAGKNVTPSTNGARGSTSSRPPARRGRKRR